MPKPDILLYDDIHRWSYKKPGDAMPHLGLKGSKDAENLLMHYRMLMRKARRFYLDDDFVEKSMEVATDEKKTVRWTPLARLPYSTVWFEFDCHVKVNTAHKLGTLSEAPDLAHVPPRLGVLLQTIDEETGTWAMTTFGDHTILKKGQEPGDNDLANVVIPESLCFFLAPEGPNDIVMHPPKPWPNSLHTSHDPLAKLKAYNEGFRKGLPQIGLGFIAGRENGQVGYRSLPEFDGRIQIAHEPLHGAALDRILEMHNSAVYEEAKDRTAEASQEFLRENSGIVRWMITILAMMNEAPNVKHYTAAQNGHRMANMKSVPYLDHHTVTLTLPKTKPVVSIKRALNRGIKDRAHNRGHEVRGHWRCVEYGKHLPYPCKHLPTLVEKGVGICLKCERMIRWIKDIECRGDASLGFVRKDYVVNAAKGNVT